MQKQLVPGVVSSMASSVVSRLVARCTSRFRWTFAAMLSISPLLAFAADPASAALKGERLAAGCTSCHGAAGASGGGTSGGALPSLAGQPRDALIASMKAYKDGSRPSTVMQQLAKGYTDEQIALIAAYFAAQRK